MPKKIQKEKCGIESIDVYGARVHNLKDINVSIPRNKLVVITGLSGSGKSSLAFDTVYAEGQRRYAESLSTYARQFLGLLDRPDVDKITGLSPTIAIDQKSNYQNPRSTVGTVTEIYDYLRVLFAKLGQPFCPECGEMMVKHTLNDVLKDINKYLEESDIGVLFPLEPDDKHDLSYLLDNILMSGYKFVLINGKKYGVEEVKNIPAHKIKKIYVYGDILRLDKKTKIIQGLKMDHNKNSFAALVKKIFDLGNGKILILREKNLKEHFYSENFYCEKCGRTLPKMEPRCFSFNSPIGACPKCKGIGTRLEVDPDLVIPNKNLTLAEGALDPFNKVFPNQSTLWKRLEELGQKYGFSFDTDVKNMKKEHLDIILFGEGCEGKIPLNPPLQKGEEFEGIANLLLKKYEEGKTEYIKNEIENYLKMITCSHCGGKRLKKEMLNIKVFGKSIDQMAELSIDKLLEYMDSLGEKDLKDLHKNEQRIAGQIIREIRSRLYNLCNSGVEYLTLSRSVITLAGGEFQRIKLATQISSSLTGIIYILDEPSIGLHPKDNSRLIKTLKELRDQNNSVIIVEHDKETIMAADYVIDVGPGAGEYGGNIVAQGVPEQILKNKNSLTGKYLSGDVKIPVPEKLRSGSGKFIFIKNASEFNLKKIDVEIPLGKLVCVTGVSGSGKSTLINDILARFLMKKFYHAKDDPGKFEKIEGVEHLNKVINIDQSPIGRTPRSNPATYTGLFTYIRDLFSNLPESRMRGYKVGNFSFNVHEGRCEACAGEGMIKIQMPLLQDIYIECEECNGKRYCPEYLEIHWHNKNIADILDMSVLEAMEFFKEHSFPIEGKMQAKKMENEHNIIYSKLKTLNDVGLGYLKLGQPATTLSGGEAQRIKLAAELSKKSTGKTLYILDEPTTGLHFDDISRLLYLLNRLVDQGNTVLVIEHNLDVIKCADWVIDMGPFGGEKGGYIVAEGTPSDIIKSKESFTGKYLKENKN